MTLQRLLLKLHARGLLPSPARQFVQQRPWLIEGGEGAGLKIGFPQNLDFIAGSSELPVQHAVRERLRPGDVFYDVGANVGFFSLLAGRAVGPAGAVYSFEPVAENVAAIRRNAVLNGFSHVSALEVAASDESRSGQLFVTEWDGGSSLVAAVLNPAEPVRQRPVRIVTLDELVQSERLKPPTFVKIDVEGAELAAIRGMSRTLTSYKPTVLYEVDDGDKATFERRRTEIDDYVRGLGFAISHLPNSYANVNWHVGHSLATPLADARR